jgi:hypothetical protein
MAHPVALIGVGGATIATGDGVEESRPRSGRAQHSSPPASLSDDGSLAAVELAADIVESTVPREIRSRLLTGLVRDLAMDGAALWVPYDREQGGSFASMSDCRLTSWTPSANGVPGGCRTASCAPVRGSTVASSATTGRWNG